MSGPQLKPLASLVIVDIENILKANREIIEKYSAIRWAKTYQLPISISVINSNRIGKSAEKLSQLIDYSPNMPIVWCNENLDFDFVQRTMDAIYSYI